MFNHGILCLPFLPITMVHCVFLGSWGKTWQLVVPINLTSPAWKEWPQCAFNQTQDTYSPNLRKSNNITCEKRHRSTSWWDVEKNIIWMKFTSLFSTMFIYKSEETGAISKTYGYSPQMWVICDSLNWWKLEIVEIKKWQQEVIW